MGRRKEKEEREERRRNNSIAKISRLKLRRL